MEDVSAYALGIDLIVHNILKHLTYVELLRVQAVCKVWKNSVQEILSYRNKVIVSFSRHETFQNHVIASTKRKRIKIPLMEAKKQGYLQAFIEWRNSWNILPDNVLLICPVIDSDETVDDKKTIHSLISETIPDTCRLAILTNTKIENESKEYHFFNGWALSATEQLTTSFYTWPSFRKKGEKLAFLEKLDCHLQKQTDLKLFMVFVHISSSRDYYWVADKLLPDLKKKIFKERGAYIMGSMLNQSTINMLPKNIVKSSLSMPNQSETTCQYFSYMISGKDVSVSSIVLQCQSCDHEIDEEFNKLVDEKLSRLKQSVEHKKVVLKFVVSCCSQQGNLKTVDKEINGKVNKYTPMEYAFDDKFPNVPTLSLTSTGEIGFDYNLIGEQMPIDSVNQEYCSIFTIVSLPEPITET